MLGRKQQIFSIKKGMENILSDNQICIYKMVMLECSVNDKEDEFNP